MKHIFLVKKNPALPGSDDNWIYMNYQQYQRFLNTPEGRERKNNFAQIDRVSRRDVLYTIEGDSDVVKKIMVEKDAHDYLPVSSPEPLHPISAAHCMPNMPNRMPNRATQFCKSINPHNFL